MKIKYPWIKCHKMVVSFNSKSSWTISKGWHKTFFLLFACRDTFAHMSIIFAFFKEIQNSRKRILCLSYSNHLSIATPRTEWLCFVVISFIGLDSCTVLFCVVYYVKNLHNDAKLLCFRIIVKSTCNCTITICHEPPHLVRMNSIIL